MEMTFSHDFLGTLGMDVAFVHNFLCTRAALRVALRHLLEQIFLQREFRCAMTSRQLRSHIVFFTDKTNHSFLEQKLDKYSRCDANMNNANTLLAAEAVDHFFRQRAWSPTVVLTIASIETRFLPDGPMPEVSRKAFNLLTQVACRHCQLQSRSLAMPFCFSEVPQMCKLLPVTCVVRPKHLLLPFLMTT